MPQQSKDENESSVPLGAKLAIFLNALIVVYGLWQMAQGMGVLAGDTLNPDAEIEQKARGLGVGLGLIVYWMQVVAVLTGISYALLTFRKFARTAQIIASLFLMSVFPWGTVAYGAVLCFFILSKEISSTYGL